MGDINSKNCIDAIQGASVIKSNPSQSSGKNNIVVVNPEIHLHSNNGIPDGSMDIDRRIKELEEELKVKQDQIDLERGIRQMVERERNAERIRNEQLLSEKENVIQDQDDLISWHLDVLQEKRACLGETYLYGQSEKRIRVEQGTIHDCFRQANKKRKKKKNKQHVNRSFTTNYPNNNNCRSQRTRSKTEINFTNDQTELWEWNGTKWVMMTANGFAQNTDQVGDLTSSKSSCAPQKRNSVATDVPTPNRTCDAGPSDEQLQAAISSTSNPTDNGQLPAKVCERSTVKASTNVVYCLDDTGDKDVNTTHLSHQHVAATEVTLPTDISISFDEREITRYISHDVTLFARRAQERTRQPETK